MWTGHNYIDNATVTQTQQLSGTNHYRTTNNITTEQKTEKIWHPPPCPSNPVLMNHPQASQPPIICSNSTMIMISLAQMKQSIGYGSVRNDDIFNLLLGSGAGHWFSIPCLLQDTSYIHWLHPPKQLSLKKQNSWKKKIKLLTNCIVLPWATYIEPKAKKGRPGTQP